MRIRVLGVFLLTTFVSTDEVESTVNPTSMCRGVSCRAGRECRVLSSGVAECVCAKQCPGVGGHRKHAPAHAHAVCGSDGMVYESNCDLHRQACLKGIHIRPVVHDHSCRKDPLNLLKRLIDKASEEVKQYEQEHLEVPEACHQNERDRMREFLISLMSLTARKQPWFEETMGYHSIIQQHFRAAANSTSSGLARSEAAEVTAEAASEAAAETAYLDSLEWLHYLHRSKKYKRQEDPDVDHRRLLCLDALIEEGDQDQDWRLNEQEFVRLMSHGYQPTKKYCIMDKKRFEDGTKTKVDCNGCVCSCGKWVCTSKACSEIIYESKPAKESSHEDQKASASLSAASKKEEEEEEEVFTYEDMDNIVQ